MKTLIATAALTVMFLSVGAFAGKGQDSRIAQPGLLHTNITVIEKNLPYPVLGPIVVTSCQPEDCSGA